MRVGRLRRACGPFTLAFALASCGGRIASTPREAGGALDDAEAAGDAAPPAERDASVDASTPDAESALGALRVRAPDLLGTSDPAFVTAFGAGSTFDDLLHNRIAYATAVLTSGPSRVGVEFPESPAAIGVDAGGGVDGVVTSLAPGAYTLETRGYLRGLVGPLGGPPATRIFLAKATCTAEVVAGAEAIARCTPLSFVDAAGAPWVRGLVFPSDFLGPAGGAAYATTQSGGELAAWGARTPASGTAAALLAERDPRGVLFVDEAALLASEAPTRETTWVLTIEPTTPGAPACTTTPGCTVRRATPSDEPLDLYFVNPATHAGCVLTRATTGSDACFR